MIRSGVLNFSSGFKCIFSLLKNISGPVKHFLVYFENKTRQELATVDKRVRQMQKISRHIFTQLT